MKPVAIGCRFDTMTIVYCEVCLYNSQCTKNFGKEAMVYEEQETNETNWVATALNGNSYYGELWQEKEWKENYWR